MTSDLDLDTISRTIYEAATNDFTNISYLDHATLQLNTEQILRNLKSSGLISNYSNVKVQNNKVYFDIVPKINIQYIQCVLSLDDIATSVAENDIDLDMQGWVYDGATDE